MTKYELEALGLNTETIRAIQKLHGRDMAKLSKKIPDQDPNAATREAIKAMLPMIQDSANLKRLLSEATYLYHVETRKRSGTEEAPASAANADGGEGGTQSLPDTVSTSMITNEGGFVKC